MYQEAHKGIREDPWKKDDEAGEKQSEKYRQQKLSKEEKRERVRAKIEEVKEAL